ncbi:MAG: hypothetical protein COV43_08485 [Deltaproteobacteria bacterium CG11_big_fil_rev_8_21_14_0_20_42_23]|nr:MAG: hypothetical protein COV43_08485 [Deltaproteobacteria bacterium CG11_big_fil_rev_8_21_14_0_20_42_23]PJC63848.1 MAG: hypothetical protein CO021_07345 [Deltaproteobacteria bacterium CG_4_9_14_0_2_um_filter_42_21]
MKRSFSKIGYILFILISLIAVQACAPKTVRLDHRYYQSLRNEANIAATHYRPPTFTVQSISGFLMGTVFAGMSGGMWGSSPAGAGAMGSASMTTFEGKKVDQSTPLEDPAYKIKEGFMSAIAHQLQLSRIQNIREPIERKSEGDLKQVFKNNFIFTFNTTSWGVEAHSLRSYDLSFRHIAKLIRLSDAQVLWQGVCQYKERLLNDETKKPLALKKLKENNATLLRVNLKKVGNVCTENLLNQFFDNGV